MKIVEYKRHVSIVSITLELNIAQKTVWNHGNTARYKKRLDVGVPHELTHKTLSTEFPSANRNKIDPFPKPIATNDEKWVTYENRRGRIAVCRRKRWPCQD